MGIKNAIRSDVGGTLVAVVLGFGLASLFGITCESRNCMVFKGPSPSDIEGKNYIHDGQCYSYKRNSVSCDSKKKIIQYS